jgi:hypothetical protein
MNADLKQAKQQIRPYLRQISDTALWQLCAMAKDGRIEYVDTCHCIRGIVGGCSLDGYRRQNSDAAYKAEHGLLSLGPIYPTRCREDRIHNDHYRNLRLLPMCRAEMRRRSRLAVGQVEKEAVTV